MRLRICFVSRKWHVNKKHSDKSRDISFVACLCAVKVAELWDWLTWFAWTVFCFLRTTSWTLTQVGLEVSKVRLPSTVYFIWNFYLFLATCCFQFIQVGGFLCDSDHSLLWLRLPTPASLLIRCIQHAGQLPMSRPYMERDFQHPSIPWLVFSQDSLSPTTRCIRSRLKQSIRVYSLFCSIFLPSILGSQFFRCCFNTSWTVALSTTLPQGRFHFGYHPLRMGWVKCNHQPWHAAAVA